MEKIVGSAQNTFRFGLQIFGSHSVQRQLVITDSRGKQANQS